MKRTILLVVLLAMEGMEPVEAALPGGHLYALREASRFQEGCFYLCECPIVERSDLQGRFTLVPLGTEDGYEVFSVVELEWTVGADLTGSPIEIRGSGSYRISASRRNQELTLDLVVGDRKPERYQSGFVAVTVSFPTIDIDVLTYPPGCYDTIIGLSAAPARQSFRPPKLQFGQTDLDRGILTTWGRLKKLWVP